MLEVLGTIFGFLLALVIFGGMITIAVFGFLKSEKKVNRSLAHAHSDRPAPHASTRPVP